MQNLVGDLKLAWRHARREPGASALTVATFALGIGLTTAMFTVVNRVLLRPLPYGQPERLVALWGENEHGDPTPRLSFEDWSDLREANRTLASTAIQMPRDVTLVLSGRGRTVAAALVSREFFDVLRAPLVVGRGFDAADEETGAVVVSETLWRTQLGGGPLDGLTLDVDGRSMPVVGATAEGGAYSSFAQVRVLHRGVRRGGGAMRNNINWTAIARLASGSFNATDAAEGERVAVINELLAEKYWPDGGAIGARIRTPGMEGYREVPWLRVIGVTADVRHGGHESNPSAHVYVLQRQRPEHRAMHVLVRATEGRVAAAARALERAVWSLDTRLAVEPRDLERELASLTGERRLFTGVLGAFAALALLLAATGTFGLFSYAVAQRAHEFAVRSALGATRLGIVSLVLRDALRLVAAGGLAGVLAAFWLTRLLEAHLAGVSTVDPLTFAAAFGVIIAVALIAVAGPSRRAASADPQAALRAL